MIVLGEHEILHILKCTSQPTARSEKDSILARHSEREGIGILNCDNSKRLSFCKPESFQTLKALIEVVLKELKFAYATCQNDCHSPRGL